MPSPDPSPSPSGRPSPRRIVEDLTPVLRRVARTQQLAQRVLAVPADRFTTPNGHGPGYRAGRAVLDRWRTTCAGCWTCVRSRGGVWRR